MLLFLSLLAVAAQIGVATIALGALHPASRAVLTREIGPHAIGIAAVVAAVSMIGSLYLSEGANFIPCTLCWYQRIAMYATAVILAVALVRRETAVIPYASALVTLGGGVSIYHMLVERFPSLESGSCDATNPCSLIWMERFGYLTIPTMALSGFLLILLVLTFGRSPHGAVA